MFAISCLVVVTLITAVPVFIAKESIDIGQEVSLKAERERIAAQFEGEQARQLILEAEKKHQSNSLDQMPVDADQVESVSAEFTTMLNKLTGGRVVLIRQWWDDTTQPARDWYRTKRHEEPIKILMYLVGILVISAIIKAGLDYLFKYHMSYAMFLINFSIREKILNRVLHQHYLYFTRKSTGYLTSRISSDTQTVGQVVQYMISTGIQAPLTVVIMFGVLLYLSVKLTLGVMVVLPVVGGLLYLFARQIRKNTKKQRKKSDVLSHTLTESLNNVRLVKAFGTEQCELDKFHDRTMDLFKYVMRQKMAKFGAAPLMEVIGSLSFGAVVVVGAYMIRDGEMTAGSFVAYMFALSRFYRPLKAISNLITKYQQARVSVERMLEMLALESEVAEVENPTPLNDLKESIELQDVGFSYIDEDRQVKALEGVNFTVQPGQCIAFAGASGSGKTTLINILARLIDPTEGKILVDGQDLREYSLRDWHRMLGMVTQDTILFNDSLANNIAYGSDHVDMERIRKAAIAAHADEFISPMPEGYETVVGPGGLSLSGGQRQRLAIARAIYRDPKILILDEATSALDSESQAIVQAALAKLMVGRTTFVIAHRISTILHADCIYVLENGHVVEHGTHAQLVAMGGTYAEMVSKADVGVEPVFEGTTGD